MSDLLIIASSANVIRSAIKVGAAPTMCFANWWFGEARERLDFSLDDIRALRISTAKVATLTTSNSDPRRISPDPGLRVACDPVRQVWATKV